MDVIKQHIYGILILIVLVVLSGCLQEGDNPAEKVPFQIVAVSDVHVRLPGNPDDGAYDNQGNLDNISLAIDLINELYSESDFVAVTGDLVGTLFSENPEDYLSGMDNPAERFKQMFDTLIPPYHVAFGNHDYHTGFDMDLDEHITTLNFDAVESVWKKVLDKDPYYSFVHKGFQMIFLNSSRGATRFEICPGLDIEALCKGSFDPAQLDWLESCLQRPEPAILFCHHPPLRGSDGVNSSLFSYYSIDPDDRFYDILEQYKDKIPAMFVGHWHLWQDYTLFDTIEVHETGPLGDMFGSEKNISIIEIDPRFNSVNVTRHATVEND